MTYPTIPGNQYYREFIIGLLPNCTPKAGTSQQFHITNMNWQEVLQLARTSFAPSHDADCLFFIVLAA